MSVNNVTVDLARLSFDTPESAYLLSTPLLSGSTGDHNSSRPSAESPSIRVTKERTPRNRNRNRQIVPSDDEEEEEDEEEEDEDEDEEGSSRPKERSGDKAGSDHERAKNGAIMSPLPARNKPASGVSTPSKPGRKTQPLPSDDEDSEEEGEDSDSESRDMSSQPMYRLQTNSTPNVYGDHRPPFQQRQSDSSNNSHSTFTHPMPEEYDYDRGEEYDEDNEILGQHVRNQGFVAEGSQLQQLQQMQQYHQAQIAQFQYHQHLQPQPSKSASHLRPYSNPQRISMSGMDLLKQLEQDKADLRRQKPKLNTSDVKIEGLLGRLPEPGSHNISFQQIQQQNGMRKSRSGQRPVSSYGYLDMPYPPARSPSPNGERHSQLMYSQPMGYPYGYVPNVPYDYVPNPSVYAPRTNGPIGQQQLQQQQLQQQQLQQQQLQQQQLQQQQQQQAIYQQYAVPYGHTAMARPNSSMGGQEGPHSRRNGPLTTEAIAP
ncbi:hypothetical protein BDF14DRAFT_35337 [Spinellus fusiger]|nr:hypothetical protein BDF14DRAFT_35337 [Spinellus fusiger]